MSTGVEDYAKEEVVSLELPAPPGWKKKLFLMQGGGTPKRREIVFTSPTGDEINNKRQLDRYLKEHPGSPAASGFDWGTGEAPRRSSRISEKTKAFSLPEHGRLPKKRRTKLAALQTITEKDANSQIKEYDSKGDKEEKGAPHEDLKGDKQSREREEEIKEKVTVGETEEKAEAANALMSEERENGERKEVGDSKAEMTAKEKDEEQNGKSKQVECKI